MNKLTIIGRACRDPEMRTTQAGKSVCSFSVAVDRRGRDKGADFFRVTCWEKLAEIAHKYVAKGKQVAVIGSVSVSEYEGRNGKSFSLDVTAETLELLGSAKDGQTGAADAEGAAAAPAAAEGYTQVKDDELPF